MTTDAMTADAFPEPHYATCSPWQDVPYDEQIDRKRAALADAFRDALGEDPAIDAFRDSPQRLAYRTKMEFSFSDQDGRLCLAFHQRGRRYDMVTLPHGCALGGERANAAALALADRLGDAGVAAAQLKSLVVRESKSGAQVVAALYVREPDFAPPNVDGLPGLDGLTTIYSDPRSPAAVTTEVLRVEGRSTVHEQIDDVRITYPVDGFFQNNLPVFQTALADLRAHFDPVDELLELFAGVGTIGLALADRAAHVTGVEVDAIASEYAQCNAARNGVGHYLAIPMAAQKVQRPTIREADALVLDPPRDGLAPRLVARIGKVPPPCIYYLSCNPVTLARDYAGLRDHYRPCFLAGYDFFPHTPHTEALLILERRSRLP